MKYQLVLSPVGTLLACMPTQEQAIALASLYCRRHGLDYTPDSFVWKNDVELTDASCIMDEDVADIVYISDHSTGVLKDENGFSYAYAVRKKDARP